MEKKQAYRGKREESSRLIKRRVFLIHAMSYRITVVGSLNKKQLIELRNTNQKMIKNIQNFLKNVIRHQTYIKPNPKNVLKDVDKRHKSKF